MFIKKKQERLWKYLQLVKYEAKRDLFTRFSILDPSLQVLDLLDS